MTGGTAERSLLSPVLTFTPACQEEAHILQGRTYVWVGLRLGLRDQLG